MGHTRTSIVFAMVMAGGLAASLPAAAAFDDVRRPPLGPPTEQSSAALDPVATPQREAAEQGDAAAQFALGGQYATGDGVPQDMAQAVEWWRRAARTGHVLAELNLATAYQTGVGVPRNGATAVAWYRRAADQGDQPRSCTSAKRTRTARASR